MSHLFSLQIRASHSSALPIPGRGVRHDGGRPFFFVAREGIDIGAGRAYPARVTRGYGGTVGMDVGGARADRTLPSVSVRLCQSRNVESLGCAPPLSPRRPSRAGAAQCRTRDVGGAFCTCEKASMSQCATPFGTDWHRASAIHRQSGLLAAANRITTPNGPPHVHIFSHTSGALGSGRAHANDAKIDQIGTVSAQPILARNFPLARRAILRPGWAAGEAAHAGA
jgi:hypothetical protein